MTEECAATVGGFVTTQWTAIIDAANSGSDEATQALERLCQTYWWPLYAYVRRRGKSHHDAEDRVQGFFQQLLARNSLAGLDRSKGKFRAFLLACLKNYLAKDWARRSTQKMGGNCQFVSIDAESADSLYLQIASSNKTPDQVFDQQWSITFLTEVVNRLKEEYVASGRANLFEAVKGYLAREAPESSYQELAPTLGMTEAALKMAVHRMRKRYQELLEEEMARFVAPQEVKEELRALVAALS